jgi:hypothetical protein
MTLVSVNFKRSANLSGYLKIMKRTSEQVDNVCLNPRINCTAVTSDRNIFLNPHPGL